MDGVRIRALLEHKKATASQLARFCGVSAQSGLNWANDVVQPREAHLDRIAEFFGLSRQELEYGPLLCISAPEIPSAAVGNLNKEISIQTAELMIAKELSGSPKSIEFKKGMLDRIVYKLSGVTSPISFKIGTCQYDAYIAGKERAEIALSNMKTVA